MALDDFFEVKASWLDDNSGQEANWVFHVQNTVEGSGTGDAPNLATIVANSIDSIFPNVTNSKWIPQVVTVQNLNDPGDFAESALTYTPNALGAPMPSLLAVGIRSPKQAFGHNRARANLPCLDSSHLSSFGRISEAGLEAMEPVAAYAGSVRVAASTGEQWRPVTVRKIYTNKVLTDVQLRSVVTGLWQINEEWTTVKSRQAYRWTDID